MWASLKWYDFKVEQIIKQSSFSREGFRKLKIRISQTKYIAFSALLVLDLNSFINVQLQQEFPSSYKWL